MAIDLSKATPRPWKIVPGPQIVDGDGKDVLASWKPATHLDCIFLVAAVNSFEAARELAQQVAAIDYKSELLRRDGWADAQRKARKVLRLMEGE